MSVIIYRYDTSPFSIKIDNVLLLKNIQHEKVNVANILPRPEITDLLGVTHRRIPILAIGNDIYCDTSLIASALERRFPAAKGYGTIFPKKLGGGADTGLIKAFTLNWIDTIVFGLGVRLVPWDSLPPAFLEDRKGIMPSGAIDMEAANAGRGNALSALSSNLALLEEQLTDGREWLFETERPSLADITLHVLLGWMKQRNLPGVDSLLDANTFPQVVQWLARMTQHVDTHKQGKPAVLELKGEEAAKHIVAADFEPYSVVGFDEREAERLKLKAGDEVSITRDDYGAHIWGTAGKLVALNKEEFVLETKGSAGLIRCHFPRLGYSVKLGSQLKA
ncbi:glutathione S-transferase [Favolaschia claudopus]|uniref:Glutathione S-transferase n=1 Tax=Favolaschia claudopus TaxID=2862362 RepID=A0AAW0EBV8_9AGAR